MASKACHKFRKQVERIIHSHGGIIFGGHVRDTILRDTHADAFYMAGLVEGKDFRAPHVYEDPSFHPEFKGRLVVSTDIDCYMVAHSINDFIADLEAENIEARVVFDRSDAKTYLPNLDVPDGILRHMRLHITHVAPKTLLHAVQRKVHPTARKLIRGALTDFISAVEDVATNLKPLCLDILVARCHDFNAMFPPFGGADFECNALLMTAGGIMLSPSVFRDYSIMMRQYKVNAIIDDIKSMRAVYVDTENLTARRIQKMRCKGWDVSPRIIVPIAANESEMCIICHDDLPCGKSHFKLPCCNARYHRDCLVAALTGDTDFSMKRTMQCIMCKKYTNAYTEAELLRS